MVDNEVDRHIEGLKSHDADVRRAAARALGDIGPDAKDAVPALIEALEDDEVSLIAIWALGQIGPAARSAAPAITQLMERPGCAHCRNYRAQLTYLPEETQGRLKGISRRQQC